MVPKKSSAYLNPLAKYDSNSLYWWGSKMLETSIRNERFTINMETAATIFQSGLNNLSFLESNCPEDSKFINSATFSNGDSLRFLFTQRARNTYSRSPKAEIESRRVSGNYDFHNSERKRKCYVHRKANPQRRPRLLVDEQPNFRDPDETLFFVAQQSLWLNCWFVLNFCTCS
ncbi:hypothetical protein P9112_006637 [Eukaryota sp. TZLM1-RC]